MKRKAKGTRAELRSRDFLVAAGYWVARFAGSFGPFDIAAFKRHAPMLLVQVKCKRWPNGKEMRNMREFPAPPTNCKKLIHRWLPYQRVPEIKEVE